MLFDASSEITFVPLSCCELLIDECVMGGAKEYNVGCGILDYPSSTVFGWLQWAVIADRIYVCKFSKPGG
jgi:hypothetical protein